MSEKPGRVTRARCQLTGLDDLLISLLACKLNIDKINLEFLICLDANQERGTAAGGNDLVGIVLRLEDESEGTLELFENGFNKLGERDALVWLRIVNIFCEDGDGLRVGLALKLVATVLENEAEGGSVSNDPVVYDDEVAAQV